VKWIDEVLQVALMHMPVPLPVVETAGVAPAVVEKPRRRTARPKPQSMAH